MDEVVNAAWTLLAAVLTALASAAGIWLRAWVEVQRQRAMATLQQRLGEAAGRVAGEILLKVDGDPAVARAAQALVEAGARTLQERFAEQVRKHGIPVATLEGMVAGEVGKLLVGGAR